MKYSRVATFARCLTKDVLNIRDTRICLAPRAPTPTLGRTSTPRCPLPIGLYCHAWETRWKTASTSSAFTTPWSGPSWTWPTHSTTHRSVRLSDSSCVGMGGKSSPNTWGRFAAANGRVVSSVFSGDEFRCEIYVDDTFLDAGDSLGERSRTFIFALLAIAVLGSPLAWDIASLGDRELWKTSAPQRPFQRTSPMPCTPDVPVPVSHSCTKNDIRSILPEAFVLFPALRPFVDMVWAALVSRLLLELVHCHRHRRFRVAFWWLQALFSEVPGPLGVWLMSWLKVSSLWHGTQPPSRRTTFASSDAQAQHHLGSSRPPCGDAVLVASQV